MNDTKFHYDRLKTLYSISKDLSQFLSVEESFSNILTCASESFPLLSAVLIEHWDKKPNTAVWFTTGMTQDQISAAIVNAKDAYTYLSRSTIAESDDFLLDVTDQIELQAKIRSSNVIKVADAERYIVLPLMIDNLPPLGAIQLEGDGTLTEYDLEFVSALTNLLSVALDRYYKTKLERALKKKEADFIIDLISHSTTKVESLELERDLRENFVSLLTHDLRSPMTVIMMSAELIMKKKDSPETCHLLARNIVGQSNRVAKMISDLLDSNQIRSGKGLILKIEELNLNLLVKDTLSQLKMIHGDRFKLEAPNQIIMKGDSNGIVRVIENLCNNAIKYGFSHTPIIISLKESESDVRISIHNQGDAIAENDQKSLFQQFRRTENAIKSANTGWGIGLTLVRGVAEAHGGTVKVESEPGLGTTFTVLMPKLSSS